MTGRGAALTRLLASKTTRDGFWILFGQILSALGALVGTRLITELAPPALFGGYALLNGLLGLSYGVLFQPLAQAALRHYPEFEALATPALLRRQLLREFMVKGRRVVLALVIAGLIDALTLRHFSLWIWCALGLTVVLEGWKTVEIIMRNAARKNRSYAMLFAMDSLGRIGGSVLFAWLFGASLESLLIGQLSGGLVVMVLYAVFAPAVSGSAVGSELPGVIIDTLRARMHHFAAPLIWMPVVGWVSGLSDRYILAGMVGVAAAGIYSAAYGLASRLMLMIGTVSEATLRQLLYAAVVAGDDGRRIRVIRVWVTGNLLIGATAAVAVTVLAEPIANLLLAESYRAMAASILPWLAFGYLPLVAAQPFERLAYANHRTRAVTLVQIASAIAAVTFAALGAWIAGVHGVAAAVPAYFVLQLVLTVWVATRNGPTKEPTK